MRREHFNQYQNFLCESQVDNTTTVDNMMYVYLRNNTIKVFKDGQFIGNASGISVFQSQFAVIYNSNILPNKYLCMTRNGIYQSDDGINFSVLSGKNSGNGYRFMYDGVYFWSSGHSFASAGNKLSYSSDLVNWTEIFTSSNFSGANSYLKTANNLLFDLENNANSGIVLWVNRSNFNSRTINPNGSSGYLYFKCLSNTQMNEYGGNVVAKAGNTLYFINTNNQPSDTIPSYTASEYSNIFIDKELDICFLFHSSYGAWLGYNLNVSSDVFFNNVANRNAVKAIKISSGIDIVKHNGMYYGRNINNEAILTCYSV